MTQVSPRKTRVCGLNKSVGGCVIPIGRHSIMNGVALGGAASLDPRMLEAFAKSVNTLSQRMERLSDWADEIVRRNCADGPLLGLATVPIAVYLDAVTTLSREAAFEAMCEWWLEG